MAMIEEFERTGNWLFKGRSFFPLIWYVLMALVIGMGWDPYFRTFDASVTWSCIAVSMFGQFIRALTIGYTPRGTSGRNTAEGQIAEVLNTRGMYSLVRHPLYLGNYFMWLGLGNAGSEVDFINSLTGPPGNEGPQGPEGNGFVEGTQIGQIVH